MSFLIRYVFRMDDGRIEHDETVVATVESLVALEKGVWIEGKHGTLRVEFDPPLAPVAESGDVTSATL